MAAAVQTGGLLRRVPALIRAIAGGLLVGMIAANVWPMLLLMLGVPIAACVEIIFLSVYVWWASGGGWPQSLKVVRADYFRANSFSAVQLFWGIVAAASFAATINGALIVLFRLVPFPAAAFHAGYDFSFIPSRPMQWLACVVSALSAGVCEETGFRGYLQRPIEHRNGPAVAIVISSLVFTLIHLTKGWALIGMVPIVFAAGILLGTLAYASGTLVFCMLGHWLMDIVLFAYWWTQIASTFSQRTIFESGADSSFWVQCALLATALIALLTATIRLGQFRSRSSDPGVLS